MGSSQEQVLVRGTRRRGAPGLRAHGRPSRGIGARVHPFIVREHGARARRVHGAFFLGAGGVELRDRRLSPRRRWVEVTGEFRAKISYVQRTAGGNGRDLTRGEQLKARERRLPPRLRRHSRSVPLIHAHRRRDSDERQILPHLLEYERLEKANWCRSRERKFVCGSKRIWHGRMAFQLRMAD